MRGDAVLISAKIPGSGATAYPAVKALVIWANCVGLSAQAFGKDGDDDDPPKSTAPTVDVDPQTTCALALGFCGSSYFNIFQSIALAAGNALSAIPTSAKQPSVQAIAVEIPLTVDVTDRVSIETVLSADAEEAAQSGAQLTQGSGSPDLC